MLIMTTTWIPYGKESKSGKKYLEVMKKYPTDKSSEKTILLIGASATEVGMRVISITEAKKGKFEEAMKLETKRMLEFSSIEGISYKIETLLSGTEAMSMLGLTMPE